MKVLFSVGLIFVISQVGAFAQYGGGGQGGQGGPPGGGSGGGSGPQSPASFTASQIGASNPLADRLLALTVPGSSQMPANFDGSVPRSNADGTIPMTTIGASTWNVGFEAYDPNPPYTQVVMASIGGPVFTGSGATGGWNGTDPGWTILPNGNQAGGYGQFAMQIAIDIGWPYNHSPVISYQYVGFHTYFYGIPGNPSRTESRNIQWSSGILHRSKQ